MAEQVEPVRRRVALKVIKLGMDTRQVIARFEAERQALALMDHPHIAKVLEAGATETGRPFFVMELVKGIPLTRYCDEHWLDLRARLGLFVQICQAIQHAHQKGIIHRDIKPSNVLIADRDGVPVPKVIDFGIAKATTDQPLTDKTLFTAFEQFIGTPAYMSPEQAKLSDLDVDTRTDIYSLGVLLYELLTGKTPLDAQRLLKAGLDEVRRLICEAEPLRPSTRLRTLEVAEQTTLAKHRQCEPPRLLHLLRGDLDWIVMKTLEKDRTRRYETANGLAMDVQRYLADEPIVARPPSKLYEFQKTVRRHKLGFLATGAVILTLGLGLAVSTRLWFGERQAHQRAVVAEAKAETNETRALAEKAAEAQLRKEAEAQELLARRRAYASDINLAQQAVAANNVGRARELLDRNRPSFSTPHSALSTDFRGWEWRYLWQQSRSEALYSLCVKSNTIICLAASPDGRWLALREQGNGAVSVWDLPSRQEIALLAADSSPIAFPANAAVERQQSTYANYRYGPEVAFSPDGLWLGYMSHLGSGTNWQPAVFLWNTQTRQPGGELPLDEPSVQLAFGSDGKTLLTVGRKRVTLWGLPERRKIATYELPVFVNFGTTFAATSDLRLVAGADQDGRIRVLDLVQGKELWRAQATSQWVTALGFSQNGKILASGQGYAPGPIRLWDVSSGRELARLEGQNGWISALVFGADGRWLASAGGDSFISLWDTSDLERGRGN